MPNMKTTLLMAVLIGMAMGGNDKPDWEKVKLLGQQLQSGIATKNTVKVKYYAELIIAEMPSDETTYYAGVRTGQEVALTMGSAKSMVGESFSLRINQWTRAVGEYLMIDRHIPGLTLLITGEDVLNDLMGFGWSYRLNPNGHYPVYAATKTLPGKGEKYTGGKTYADKYVAFYDGHVKDHMVAIHPHQADIERMTKYESINLVFADVTPRSVGGRLEHVLVTRGHYTIQAGKVTHVWEDRNDCETCDPDYQVFQ
uniref:VP2 n=1 Tax=Jingmen tick virus TaxID=1172985 RepID=A0A6B9PGA1_9FLAV|nr:VP2 [Jingmen tick virus]